MHSRAAHPLVHLELHTDDRDRACELYAELCGWPSERIHTAAGSYRALELGGEVGGGVVECGTRRPVWLPYVEVEHIGTAAQRARELGALVLLEPREGPAGWRSVISTPAGGELAFWQPKTQSSNGHQRQEGRWPRATRSRS